MKDVNKVMLIGRLGADPTLLTTKNGYSVSNFSLATSRKYRDPKDETALKEDTAWHRVVVWGRDAENCAKYLKKGNRAYVEGHIRTRKYEKDGTERFISEVYAESVGFLSQKKVEFEVESTIET
jgi:single-strand DNA-binding protein